MIELTNNWLAKNEAIYVDSRKNHAKDLNEAITTNSQQREITIADQIKERLDYYFQYNQNRQSIELSEILSDFKNESGVVVISDYQFSQYGVLTLANFSGCEFVRCDFSYMMLHAWKFERSTFTDCKFDHLILAVHSVAIIPDIPYQITRLLAKSSTLDSWHWFDRDTDSFQSRFEDSEQLAHFKAQLNYLSKLPAFAGKFQYHVINHLARNVINERWQRLFDPIQISSSTSFFQFTNLSIRADDIDYDINTNSLGWKLHVSVDPDKLEQAFNLLFLKIITCVSTFKIINVKAIKDVGLEGRLRSFAQITIYLSDHPSNQPILPIAALKALIVDIVETLRTANIQPGEMTESDARMQIDGKLIDYVTIRNDRYANDCDTYISASFSCKNYNPANRYNPYRELIWDYQPYCAEEVYKHMDFTDDSFGLLTEIRGNLWTGFSIVVFGMLRNYLKEETIESLFKDNLFVIKPDQQPMRDVGIKLLSLAFDPTNLRKKFENEILDQNQITNIQSILLIIAYLNYVNLSTDIEKPSITTLNFETHRISPALKQTLKQMQETAAAAEVSARSTATDSNEDKFEVVSLTDFIYADDNMMTMFNIDFDDTAKQLKRLPLAIQLCHDAIDHHLNKLWLNHFFNYFLLFVSNTYRYAPKKHHDYIEELLVTNFNEKSPLILAAFYLAFLSRYHKKDDKAKTLIEKSKYYLAKYNLQAEQHPAYSKLQEETEKQLMILTHDRAHFFTDSESEDESDSLSHSLESESALYQFSTFSPKRAASPIITHDNSTELETANSYNLTARKLQ